MDEGRRRRLYTLAVTFPDSTPASLDYKYWYGKLPAAQNHFECVSLGGNRNFQLDDYNYSVAVPQPRPVDILDNCVFTTGVEPPAGGGALVDFASLAQNAPNPAGFGARIRFSLKSSGWTRLEVFDITGRHVASLANGLMTAGPHEAQWNGRDEAGRALGNGVYMYELSQGGQRMSRRMILIQR